MHLLINIATTSFNCEDRLYNQTWNVDKVGSRLVEFVADNSIVLFIARSLGALEADGGIISAPHKNPSRQWFELPSGHHLFPVNG